MIIGIPSAAGCLVKSKGVAHAPGMIYQQVSVMYNQKNLSPPEYNELMLPKNNIRESFLLIERAAEHAPRRTFFLGGDHSVTYPLVKGVVKNSPSIGIVIFDAHPDSMHYFSPPSQEDFVRVLLEEQILSPQQIFLVGLRSFYHDEKRYLDQKKVRCYPMPKIFDMGMQQLMDVITEQLLPFSTLYVSVDIDCIDPAFAPGVDYPEPGGFSSRELLYALQRLARMKNFSYLDLVEVNPEKDNGQTVLLAAKLIDEACTE